MRDWTRPNVVPVLSPLDVHVWMGDISELAPLRRQLEQLLDDGELRDARAFMSAEDTTRYIITRGALRLLLGTYVAAAPRALVLERGPFGKPAMANGHDTSFNASHSGDRLLFGFTRGGEIGVDVERVRPGASCADFESVIRRAFSPREQHAMSHSAEHDRLRSFYAIWARKESYIKATGAGLSQGLERFTVSHGRGDARLLDDSEDSAAGSKWRMEEVLSAGEYAAAVTYSSKLHKPLYLSLNAGMLEKLC